MFIMSSIAHFPFLGLHCKVEVFRVKLFLYNLINFFNFRIVDDPIFDDLGVPCRIFPEGTGLLVLI